jgi:hypothetical protein
MKRVTATAALGAAVLLGACSGGSGSDPGAAETDPAQHGRPVTDEAVSVFIVPPGTPTVACPATFSPPNTVCVLSATGAVVRAEFRD